LKSKQKNILVAPLNWGLGHATRCIPIIQNLEIAGFTPIIASDGTALQLLKLEFPHLKFLELPAYGINYPKNGKNFRWKMLLNIPRIILAAAKERKLVQKWVNEHQLTGIISDNRLGVYSKKIPSVYFTHQLQLLTGSTTYFSTKIHQKIIDQFTECWVPDCAEKPNLSGKLGHLSNVNSKVKYIGALSRFRKIESDLQHDLLVLLSGPEPQRTFLEEKIVFELKNYDGKVVFIKGIVSKTQEICQTETILFYNFMQTAELEKTMNESKLILCRSGYSSIMDLAILEKKAFFIPTPGQFEQEYLAKKFQEEMRVPFCNQADFTKEKLNEVQNYKGVAHVEKEANWHELFNLFDGEGEL
jgi:predicted glycosyltransferase